MSACGALEAAKTPDANGYSVSVHSRPRSEDLKECACRAELDDWCVGISRIGSEGSGWISSVKLRHRRRSVWGRNGRRPRRPGKSQPPAVRTKTAQDPFIEVLRHGGSLTDAVVADIRGLLARGERDLATAVAASLRTDPDTAELGDLTTGIVAATEGYLALAWSHLRDLPEPVWVRHAAEEWVRAGFDQESEHARKQLARLADEAPDFVPASAWLAMFGPVFGHGCGDLAKQLFTVFDARVGDGSAVEPSLVVHRDWLRPWVAARSDGPSAPAAPDGSVSFAVMDYGHPGRSRASANIGDHVQSLASLGHLVRHQDLRYDGRQDLVDLLTQLRSRVRPELQRHSEERRVALIQIDRDASMYAAIPPNTWTLAFGWYMHAIFGTRYGFPFHPNLLPIFVSFHCSKRDLLTEEAVAYLRRFAPIGCRDWTTVDILLSVDVPAFFSGCLTSTARTVFPERVDRPAAEAPVAYVDMPKAVVPHRAPVHAHSSDAIRFRSFATNVSDAVDLLETYRGKYRGVVTSRLHGYLPLRSLGVPVDFQPKNRSDPRFAGLIDITDDEFDSMQTRIDGLLEEMFEMILAGRAPDEVYSRWRELTADEVAAAQRRRTAEQPMPPPVADLVRELVQVRHSHPTARSDAVSVVVPVSATEAEAVQVLLSSVAEQASGEVRFFLLARHDKLPGAADLNMAAGGYPVEVISTASVGNDLRAAGRVPTPLDIDRLVLPELLPDIERVVVLPAASVVSADIADLFALDLGGRLFAAPDPAGRSGVSGFGVLNTAANRLGARTAAATELRRRAYARHRFDFDAFDIDVMVLDLAAWRDRAVLTTYIPYVEEFGLTFRELLHLAVGPDRAIVPTRWFAVPGRSVIAHPALVYWADRTKPWSDDVAVEQQRWLEASGQLRSRRHE